MEQEHLTPDGGRNTDVPEGMIKRDFDAQMSAGDGRTVDVRVVPYGETTTAKDGHGGLPKGVPYTEQWMPGAFAHQSNATFRVDAILANFEHGQSIRDIVGHGVSLEERADGLYGSFKMHEDADGDKALMLVREGVLRHVSLEAIPRKAIRTAAGIVQRVRADLHAVAFCRKPAYQGAEVLAVRTAPILDEEILPVDMDPDLVERCRRLGIALPQRYQTHPAEPDTPAEAGTSEAAPVTETES